MPVLRQAVNRNDMSISNNIQGYDCLIINAFLVRFLGIPFNILVFLANLNTQKTNIQPTFSIYQKGFKNQSSSAAGSK
jgi:hypothetical protein